MKLAQFHLPDKGMRVGVVRDSKVLDITSAETVSVLQMIEDFCDQEATADFESFVDGKIKAASSSEEYGFDELSIRPDESQPHLLMPLHPPEVWGCGVTYKRSADMRDEDTAMDIYGQVYDSERPEIFFKATAARCVGPNDYIGIRSDSKLTATEPELAYCLGKDGEIIGYTVCNDVSAWDIERENPLYLPQSKIFYGCCALGPVLATKSDVPDPLNVTVSCKILRDDKALFEGSVHSSMIKRTFDELTAFLCRDNPVPPGTVVSTGTGVIAPNNVRLAHGDVVEIEIEGIGKLSNWSKQL